MGLPEVLTSETNDRLVTALLHVAAVTPVYAKRSNGTRADLELVWAIVYIGQEYWPLNGDQREAVSEWAIQKCRGSIKASQVTVLPESDLPSLQVQVPGE